MDDQTGCRSSCMILQFRQCLYQRLSVAFERCPADQDSSSNIGNGTHRWLPCSGGACVTTTSTASKTTTAATTANTPSKTADISSRSATNMPTVSKNLQSTTKSKLLSSKINNLTKDTKKIHSISHNVAVNNSTTPTFDEKEKSMFISVSFWVGFCIGAVSVTAIVLFSYFLCMKFRKRNVCVFSLNPSCRNSKTSCEEETFAIFRKKKTKKGVIIHHIGNSSSGTNLEKKMSVVSTSSSLKDRGSNHRPSNGSFTQHSKLAEPYQQPIEQIAAYETFYTPVGENKFQGRKLPCQPNDPIFEVEDDRASCDSFLTDTDSNSEMPRESNYENGTFYTRKQYHTQERKSKDKNGFDEAAYIQKYDECRAERNRVHRVHTDRHYGNSESLQKKRRPRRRKSYDSPLAVDRFKTEPHYAKPMKFINGRTRAPPLIETIELKDGYDVNDSMPSKRSSAYWKRVSVKSISTPALGTPVKSEDEIFEFPSPPKFVVGEHPLGNSEKEKKT